MLTSDVEAEAEALPEAPEAVAFWWKQKWKHRFRFRFHSVSKLMFESDFDIHLNYVHIISVFKK
jgi:hypothetical protein